MFDAELHCVVAEGSALATVEITRTQIEGKYFKDILSPSLYEKLETGCLAALAGRSTQIEYRFKDRAYITYIVPIYDDNHTVTGGMITSQNITGRKKMEETLRINESRFRSITENASDMIALVDTHFRIIYANPAYQTTLGYTPSEVCF